MSVEFSEQLSAFGLKYPGCAVAFPDNALAVARERGAIHLAFMPFEFRLHRTRFSVPDPRGQVGACRDDAAAVRRECGRNHAAPSVSVKDGHRLARFGIPNARGFVIARRDNTAAVR